MIFFQDTNRPRFMTLPCRGVWRRKRVIQNVSGIGKEEITARNFPQRLTDGKTSIKLKPMGLIDLLKDPLNFDDEIIYSEEEIDLTDYSNEPEEERL